MPSLINYQSYPIDIQIEFEDKLIANEYQNIQYFSVSFLSSIFHISREQSQLILDCLFRKGLLEITKEGRYRKNRMEAPKITSVFQYAEKTGLNPESIVRSVTLISASGIVAEKLSVNVGAPIYQQKRTRLINSNIVANQCNYIPYCVAPNLQSLDLSNKSFQVVLETKYHAVIQTIREEFGFIDPTKEDQDLFDLRENHKIISVQRISLSASCQPLVLAILHINPHHISLLENLWPEVKRLI